MDETVELGGNISLSGFKEVASAEMVVIKKIIGSYARKFSDQLDDYKELHLTLKKVHKTESSEKFEIHGKLMYNGKVETSEVTDRNVFVAIDSVLKKLEAIAL